MKSVVSAVLSLLLALAPAASAAVRVSARVPAGVSLPMTAAGASLGAGALAAPHFSAAPGLSLPSVQPSINSAAGFSDALALPVSPALSRPDFAAGSAVPAVAAGKGLPSNTNAPAKNGGATAGSGQAAPSALAAKAAVSQNSSRSRENTDVPSATARTGQAAAPGLPSLKDGLMALAKKALKDKHFDADFDGARPDSDDYDVEAFRVKGKPGGAVDLGTRDPSNAAGFKDKGERGNAGNKAALKLLAEDTEALKVLQEQLYAGKSGKKPRSVLIVLQAMDTAGKDGVLRHVLGPLDPQGVKVTSFKKPTQEEIDNGYLWRIKKALPEPGTIGVFNRSQYEDILVPSVLGGTDAKTIEERYAEINAFEKKLADEGVLILKFFLHIDKAEQKRRLQARLDDPTKQWKFDPSDLKMRAKWDDFQKVYGKILARTSTAWAPWYLIPANNKWFRNFLVARIIRNAMKAMGLKYPEPPEGLEDIVIPD